jgi:hypothetical protein
LFGVSTVGGIATIKRESLGVALGFWIRWRRVDLLTTELERKRAHNLILLLRIRIKG